MTSDFGQLAVSSKSYVHICWVLGINLDKCASWSGIILLLVIWPRVIQQLRGPNCTKFWPSSNLKWTIVDMLYTTYPALTFYWPPSSSPHKYLLNAPYLICQNFIVMRIKTIFHFFCLYQLGLDLETTGVSKIIIRWLIFEKKTF